MNYQGYINHDRKQGLYSANSSVLRAIMVAWPSEADTNGGSVDDSLGPWGGLHKREGRDAPFCGTRPSPMDIQRRLHEAGIRWSMPAVQLTSADRGNLRSALP